MDKIKRFLNDEEGSIAIEYVILAGCIGLVIVAGAMFLPFRNSLRPSCLYA
jgi:Flp pilus assembly pilin Flp